MRQNNSVYIVLFFFLFNIDFYSYKLELLLCCLNHIYIINIYMLYVIQKKNNNNFNYAYIFKYIYLYNYLIIFNIY